MDQHTKDKKNKKGFATLVSVLIVIAVISVISVSLLIISTDTTLLIGQTQNKLQSKVWAENCAEYAIESLRVSNTYAGNEQLNFSEGVSCNILNFDGSGNTNRVIRTQANFRGSVTKIRVNISQLTPTLVITDWEEVETF